MEGADVRRAVAEERDRDVRLAAQLEGQRRAGDGGEPAADDGVRSDEPVLDVVQVHGAAVAAAASFDLAVELRHELVRVHALRQRMRVRTVGRGDDVAVLERAADADRDRLLADRHVEEAGQVSGPEALLHLLFEAANEQHLAEEEKEPLVREGVALLLDPCHGPHASRGADGLVESAS